MLTPLKDKHGKRCELYWPDITDEIKIGDMNIKF